MKTKLVEPSDKTFRSKVFEAVALIPKGKVVNYGFIAVMIGQPRSSRQVGFALRSLSLEEDIVPWWRVVNKQGYLSIEHGEAGMEKIIQKQLLEAEGVKVEEDFTVNMHDYFWKYSK